MRVIPPALYEKGNLLVICPECNSTFPVALFGWKKMQCINCRTEIMHPSFNVVGAGAHGQSTKQVTVRLAPNVVGNLDKLATEHNTSRAGMTRYLIQIAMQGRNNG
jgi:hypothetical protein